MKKSKGIVSLVLIAALLGLLGFTCWQGFGSSHTGSARNINLGLDLAGGVSITYQTKDKNPSAEDMKDTIYKLQKRVEQYSTEAFCKFAEQVLSEEWCQLTDLLYNDDKTRSLKQKRDDILAELTE